MKVRSLTDLGLEQFRQFIESNPDRALPAMLLEGREYSSQIPDSPEVTNEGFANRFEFGNYLVNNISDLINAGYQHDVGVWSWLALYYFDQICPLRNGKRNPSRQNYYILDPHEYTRYYHHMVRTPFTLVSIHGNNAEVLLTQPLDRSGEIIEQFASRQEIVTNTTLIEAVSKLYLERSEDGSVRFKRGSAGKNTGGTFRRLAEVLGQFDLTYDFRSMPPIEILKILPSEFSRFKPESAEVFV